MRALGTVWAFSPWESKLPRRGKRDLKKESVRIMVVGAAKVKLRYFLFNPLTLPAHIADLEQTKTNFHVSSYDGFGCTRAFGPWENKLPRQGKRELKKA